MKLNKKLIYIFLFLLIIGFYFAYKFGFGKYLTLESIQANSQYFAALVSKNYLFSVILYMFIYFVVIACAIPSTAPLSMIGGFLFGVWPTVVYSTISATCGAIVTFLALKIFSKNTIEQKYGQKLGKFRTGLQEYGSFYLLILHFSFLVPFFIINSLAVLAGVSLWQFSWTTFVGFLPCAFVYAFSGQKLLSIKSVNEMFSWQFLLAIGLLLLIGTLPIIIKSFSKRKSE